MGGQLADRIEIDPRLVAAAGMLAAFVAGAAIARGATVGVGLTFALLYAPIALLNLPLGIVLWVPIVFVENLEVVSFGPTAATLLVALAWLGTLRRDDVRALLRFHRGRIALVALLNVWLALSLAWAIESGLVGDVLWQWLIGGAIFAILVSALSTAEQARWVCIAIVAGCALSVVIGLAAEGFSSAESAAKAAADQGTRVQGGAGDPNFFAAGIIPALVLLGGLAPTLRDPAARLASLLAAVLLAIGFAAAESRGALVASGVAVVASLIFFSGRRAKVVAFVAFVAAGAAVWFAAYPQAWDRISSFNNDGNGRGEFWQVATRIWEDHPVVGVGLNNFVAASPDYVRQPGPLKFVEIIADDPHVVHNTYLQMLAEAGAIGLALFLLVLVACLRAALLAARRFEARGDPTTGLLARAVLVAGLAMATASIFISNGGDKRLWILLALGPVLLAASRRAGDAPTR